jgi:hypothetical protein
MVWAAAIHAAENNNVKTGDGILRQSVRPGSDVMISFTYFRKNGGKWAFLARNKAKLC